MYRPFGAGRTRTTSISLRSIIFRELVANIIAHREYTSAAPATLMIYTDRVEFKNPNVPHYHGRIDPGNFTPFPKNPTICKCMIQIGRYEELGSGVRKVNHYLPHYAPGTGKPVFEDGARTTDRQKVSPEGAAHTSPGQRPGCRTRKGTSPERARQFLNHQDAKGAKGSRKVPTRRHEAHEVISSWRSWRLGGSMEMI